MIVAVGILTTGTTLQTTCRESGATFIATEFDITLFAINMRSAAIATSRHLKDP